ncbi:UNVERIFIED_CONTAM: Calmodulin-binding transcription activator 3 [Sesamum calycinum]|uniref:Calmodulin-binding transcription activator 3 n=1 Tax=Sesamum calycinum TaxID=2727403 RepID=A0AAW2SVT1_9LAMI
MIDAERKEDDYNFLEKGRKQTDERLQKALARMKSMVQYLKTRDPYRKLLNVVPEMQETKTRTGWKSGLVLNIMAFSRPMSRKRMHFWPITLTQIKRHSCGLFSQAYLLN